MAPHVRLLRIAIIALLLGLLTNLGVAWVLGYYRWSADEPRHNSEVVNFGADHVSIGQYKYFGAEEFAWQPQSLNTWYFSQTPRPRLATRAREPELAKPWTPTPLPAWVPAWTGFHSRPDTDQRIDDVWVLAAGWPLRSFTCSFHNSELHGPPFQYDYTVSGGIALPYRTFKKPRAIIYKQAALPLLPLWPGVAVNTLLFAPPWLPVLLIPAWRRRRRIRRLRCPICVYELGDNFALGCPECGWNRA